MASKTSAASRQRSLPRRLAGAAVIRTLRPMQRVYDRYFDQHQSVLLSFPPEGAVRGRALVSHRTEAYLRASGDPFLATHTMFGEAELMVEALRARGFAVDLISYKRRRPVPGRYDLCVASRHNFDDIAPALGPGCLKVCHLETSHWAVNNHASLGRSLEVQQSRGVTPEHIVIPPNRAIEGADCATMVGNAVTHASVAFAGKPVFAVPHPATVDLPWDPSKDFAACRSRFLWLGSRGLAHKGLGRVLEAFARMPDLALTVCGPLHIEPQFCAAFHRELHATPNITAHGWIDVTGAEFAALARATLAMLHPSCAEGQAGAVANCMRAGLIPMASPESGLDIDPGFGVALEDCSVEGIVAAVRDLAARPAPALAGMAQRAWEVGHRTYSREHYLQVFGAVIDRILARPPAAETPGYIPAEQVLAEHPVDYAAAAE